MTFGLVNPFDLPCCNTDGEIWLVLLLGLGFNQLRPWLCGLKLARWHAHLFENKGIWLLKQGMWWVGRWTGQCCRLRHKDQSGHYQQDIALELQRYRQNGILGNHQCIMYQFVLILYLIPGALAH